MRKVAANLVSNRRPPSWHLLGLNQFILLECRINHVGRVKEVLPDERNVDLANEIDPVTSANLRCGDLVDQTNTMAEAILVAMKVIIKNELLNILIE